MPGGQITTPALADMTRPPLGGGRQKRKEGGCSPSPTQVSKARGYGGFIPEALPGTPTGASTKPQAKGKINRNCPLVTASSLRVPRKPTS